MFAILVMNNETESFKLGWADNTNTEFTELFWNS